MDLIVAHKKMIRKAFLLVPCHRIPERCFHIKGSPMPICSRCISILLGYLFIPAVFFFNVPLWLGVLFQLPMIVDGYTQLKGLRVSNNTLRTITGLISGLGLSVIIVALVRLFLAF